MEPTQIIAGLVGTIVGASAGFAAVVWQFRAQRLHARRELAAELLFHSQKLHDELIDVEAGYPRKLKVNPPTQELNHHYNELLLRLRKSELVADSHTYELVGYHANIVSILYESSKESAKSGSKLGAGETDKLESDWFRSRQLVIKHLSAASGYRWWEILQRLKAKRAVRNSDVIAAARSKKERFRLRGR